MSQNIPNEVCRITTWRAWSGKIKEKHQPRTQGLFKCSCCYEESSILQEKQVPFVWGQPSEALWKHFSSLGPNRLFNISFSGITCFHVEQITRYKERALTVLGELDELSSSSGESSSSSGSVGMAGGSDGRERVWGKMKGPSVAQGASQDSLAGGSLCSRGDPWSKSSSSSCSCKTEHITKTTDYICNFTMNIIF